MDDDHIVDDEDEYYYDESDDGDLIDDDDDDDDDDEADEDEDEDEDALLGKIEDLPQDPIIDSSSLFSTSISNRKAYHTYFKVHSIHDILKFQNKEINHVCGILGMTEQHVATLLRNYHWNKEKLIENYMDNPEKTPEQAGVVNMELIGFSSASHSDAPALHSNVKSTEASLSNNLYKLISVSNFVCDICCDDEPDLLTLALSCGHRYCRYCYANYLTQKIKEEGESRNIQCMTTNCKIIIDEQTIKQIVPGTIYDRYRSLLIRTYVEDNDHYRWCPAPDCEYAIECDVFGSQLLNKVPTVTCKCNHTFCFGCGQNDHQPTLCILLKSWMKKCQDDSETANWISANTKECPQCHSTIEKNGGCNHMTCKKCKYDFCWVCMGPWEEHGTSWYSCNRYDEKSSTAARDAQTKSRQALERYLHYYNRYSNHEQSARLDQELYHRTESKMEEMQQTSELSWIEVQFLKKAVDVVVQCRGTLKYTYAFAYYLSQDNQTFLFEDNQRDLELAVELLSELLEKPIEREKISELRQQMLDKMVYVSSRREILLEDTAKGLMEGRWRYNVDL